jgi:hypothetical protein
MTASTRMENASVSPLPACSVWIATLWKLSIATQSTRVVSILWKEAAEQALILRFSLLLYSIFDRF